MQTGLIFDIKRYSINDGPGIRVTVFFKGCPLRCAWCHNPESFSPQVQKMYTASKCIGAMECIKVCPNNALTLTKQGILTDAEACLLCGKCAEACPTKAIEMTGQIYSVDQLMEIIEKERLIFDQSEGGVTISGGEPLLQSDFLISLLDACGERGFHRSVDTSGITDTNRLLEVAKRTELFLYDLKLMDSKKHREFTGVNNEKILQNLMELAKTGANINIRIPFISGVNTDAENVERTAEFIAKLAGEKKVINLLPYHQIAAHKYKKLGDEYDPGIMNEPTIDEIDRALEIFAKYDLKVIIGG
jgi:pyruvate formate lyase activating enzyme